MTARPARSARPQPRLRVVRGTKPKRRLGLSPWLAFSMVVIVSMFGMVIARTTLDRGAVELAQLSTQIEREQATAEELELQIASLQSALRIGPLAEEMGMVYPSDRQVLLMDGVTPDQPVPGVDPEDDVRLASGSQP